MKFIIVEVIPEAIHPSKGNIVQLSALKIDNLRLVDRFDYRVNEKHIYNKDLVKICSYDKDKFKYVNSTKGVLDAFKKWVEDYDLLILDNTYTHNYLESVKNNKESIVKYLGMSYTDDVIDKIIKKYNLEPTNYIVDILYEALIYESNKK